MKNVFKISAIALAFAVSAISAKAQTTTPASTSSSANGVKFSIGVDAGLPTGNFSNAYNWSLGGSVQADIPVVAKQLYVTVNAGYDNFFGKKNLVADGITYDQTNIQLLPVKAGLKFFPVGGFYIQGEAGAAFALNKSDAGFDKSAAFIWAPQVGYQFNVGGNNFIDAGVRYQGSTDFVSNVNSSKVNFVGLRVAYGF